MVLSKFRETQRAKKIKCKVDSRRRVPLGVQSPLLRFGLPEKATTAVELKQMLEFKSRLKREVQVVVQDTADILLQTQTRLEEHQNFQGKDSPTLKEARLQAKRNWNPMRKIIQTMRHELTHKRSKTKKKGFTRRQGTKESSDGGLSEYLDLKSCAGSAVALSHGIWRVFKPQKSIRRDNLSELSSDS